MASWPSSPPAAVARARRQRPTEWVFVVRPLDLVVVFTADQENEDFLRPVDLL
jgi:hypothetical protein